MYQGKMFISSLYLRKMFMLNLHYKIYIHVKLVWEKGCSLPWVWPWVLLKKAPLAFQALDLWVATILESAAKHQLQLPHMHMMQNPHVLHHWNATFVNHVHKTSSHQVWAWGLTFFGLCAWWMWSPNKVAQHKQWLISHWKTAFWHQKRSKH